MIIDIHNTGLTEKEISDFIGVNQSTTHRLRTGKHKTTTYESGVKISELHKKVMRKNQRKE